MNANNQTRMIRFMFAVLLIMMTVLAGCSSSDGNAKNDESPPGRTNADTETDKETNEDAGKVVKDKTSIQGDLKVLTPWGAGFTEQFKNLIADFNKEYPNIKVTYMEQTTADLATLIAGGEAPDLVSALGLAPDLTKNDMIEDLTPFIETDGEVRPEIFYDFAYKRSISPDGQVWALPWHVEPAFIMMYNPEILEHQGYTEVPEFDSLQSYGDFLRQFWIVENGEQVMTTYLPHEVYGPMNSLTTIAYFNGADAASFYNPADNKVTFNDPKIVEALEWIVRFKRENIDENRLSRLQSSLPENTDRFLAGKSAIQPEIALHLRNYRKMNPDIKAIPMPPASVYIGGWSFALTKAGKKENKEAAWELLKWMTSTQAGAESQQKHFGWLSGIRNNPYFEEETKRDPVSKAAYDVLQSATKLQPFMPVDYEPEFNAKWAEVMSGELEPKAFLDHMTTYTQKLIDEQYKP